MNKPLRYFANSAPFTSWLLRGAFRNSLSPSRDSVVNAEVPYFTGEDSLFTHRDSVVSYGDSLFTYRGRVENTEGPDFSGRDSYFTNEDSLFTRRDSVVRDEDSLFLNRNSVENYGERKIHDGGRHFPSRERKNQDEEPHFPIRGRKISLRNPFVEVEILICFKEEGHFSPAGVSFFQVNKPFFICHRCTDEVQSVLCILLNFSMFFYRFYCS